MPSSGDRTDPFFAFRFMVKFDEIAPAGFSDCTGLQLETEVQEYAEGGLNSRVHKLITRSRQSNITLRHGIVTRDFWDWYFDLTQGKVRARNASVRVFDPAGNQVVMEWQLRRAYPIKWIGPELSAGQSNVAVETLELVHQELVRVT